MIQQHIIKYIYNSNQHTGARRRACEVFAGGLLCPISRDKPGTNSGWTLGWTKVSVKSRLYVQLLWTKVCSLGSKSPVLIFSPHDDSILSFNLLSFSFKTTPAAVLGSTPLLLPLGPYAAVVVVCQRSLQEISHDNNKRYLLLHMKHSDLIYLLI